MYIHSCLATQRPFVLLGSLTLCLGMVYVLASCAIMQLNAFKKHAANGDYTWIAAQAVSCEKASDDCAQRHLIKGDACFRLAKADTAPMENYTCAADELAMGLALKPSWVDAEVRRQFQENLCESLRNLKDRQSGDAATQTLARFVEAAEGLYQLAPESAPAVFYLAKARLLQVQPVLLNLNAANQVPACNRLKRSLNTVLSIMETAKTEPPPHWDRFANNYQRLSFDLGSAVRAAECR